jgi:glyoxylase-like metal-dependent hydrolase (beta-lactamase superfamily II)
MVVAVFERLTPDIHRWTARHPEWHPRYEWAQEVACFAVESGDTLVLVDPLAPADEEPFWAALDRLVEASGASRIAVLITIHYHARSTTDVYRRYRDRLDVSVHAHPSVRERLGADVPMNAIEPGEPLPAGARAFAIGSPRRSETPILLPSAGALAFGDAVVGVEGELRVWQLSGMSPRREWYEERFLPTLRPLLELDFEHVLVTHGPPVIGAGRERLRRGLDAPPWSLRTG